MRIISGSRRGHKLFAFEGESVRPTTDRVKEAVFSMIQEYIPEAVVLDLFAGSGALGFEAISRGAAKAVFVDKDKKSLSIVKRNCEKLRFEEQSVLVNQDALSYLDSTKERFDLIFLDPPYNKGFVDPVLRGICEAGCLNEGGIVVLESDQEDKPGQTGGLVVAKERCYGRTIVTVYEKEAD